MPNNDFCFIPAASIHLNFPISLKEIYRNENHAASHIIKNLAYFGRSPTV